MSDHGRSPLVPDYGPLNAVKEDLAAALGDEAALRRQLNKLLTLFSDELEQRMATKGTCEACGRSAISDKDIISGIRSVQGALSLRLAGERRPGGESDIPLEQLVRQLDGGV